MFNDKFTKKNVSYLLLITYLFVLIMPLIACLVIYSSSGTLIKERSAVYDSLLSKNMMREVDNVFVDYTRIKEKAVKSKYLRELIQNSPGMIVANDYSSAKLYNELLEYMKNIEASCDVFLYFPMSDELMSSNKKINSMERFIKNFQDADRVRNDLIYGTNTAYYLLTNNDNKKFCVCSESLIDDAGRCFVKLIISESANSLMHNIKKMNDGVSVQFQVLDRAGYNVLISEKFKDIPYSSIVAEYYRTGHFIINGDKYDITLALSDETNLQYLIAFSDLKMKQRTIHFRIISVLCVFLTIILAIILIKLSIKQNQKSITSIIDLIASQRDIDSIEEKNEYNKIRKALKSLIDEQGSFKKKLASVSESLKEEYTKNLLLNRNIVKDNKNRIEACLPISFDRGDKRIIAFRISSVENLFSSENISTEEKRKDAEFIVKNIFTELLEPKITPIITHNKNLVCIMQTSLFDDSLIATINNGKQLIEDEFEFKLKIAISDLCNEVSELPSAYHQVLVMLETSEANVYSVVTSSIMKRNNAEEMYFPFVKEKEDELIFGFKNKNYEKCNFVLDTLFADSIRLPIKNTSAVKCMIQSILTTIIRYVSTLSNTSALTGIWEQIDEISDDLEIECQKDKLYCLCENICCIDIPQVKADIIEQVTDIVSKEYSNSSLNVAYIANKLNLHNVYLSALFKEKKRCGLLEFINKYRVDKAKEIMCSNPTVTIEETAAMVGYDSSKTFFRIFKKYENVTPGKYRDGMK